MMGKLLVKLKGLLGFCQHSKCFKRSVWEIYIPAIKTKRYMCEYHIEDVRKLSKYGLTIEEE